MLGVSFYPAPERVEVLIFPASAPEQRLLRECISWKAIVAFYSLTCVAYDLYVVPFCVPKAKYMTLGLLSNHSVIFIL